MPGDDFNGLREVILPPDGTLISGVARYAPAFAFTPPEHLDADASTVASWLFDEGTGTTTQHGRRAT